MHEWQLRVQLHKLEDIDPPKLVYTNILTSGMTPFPDTSERKVDYEMIRGRRRRK
jgi:hypothetical protein